MCDTKEKHPFRYKGMKYVHLVTGDYSIEGKEHEIAIEKKGSILEFANNIFTKDFIRFEKELERLAIMKHAYIILCFTLDDIEKYPHSAKIPFYIKKKIKIRGKFFLKRFAELMEQYPTIHFILAGNNGKVVVKDILNKINDEQLN